MLRGASYIGKYHYAYECLKILYQIKTPEKPRELILWQM
jgi:hypothetical protein